MDIDLILNYVMVGLLGVLYIAMIAFFLWLVVMTVRDEIRFRRGIKRRKR